MALTMVTKIMWHWHIDKRKMIMKMKIPVVLARRKIYSGMGTGNLVDITS